MNGAPRACAKHLRREDGSILIPIHERRSAPRYDLEFPIRVANVDGMTRNVGLDGVLFNSATEFAEGQEVSVDVAIALRESESMMHMEAVGTVTRCERNGSRYSTAVSFVSMNIRFGNAAPSPAARNGLSMGTSA